MHNNTKVNMESLNNNLGMKTVWLENDEGFASKDKDKPYIDYKIKNLPSFLKKINIKRFTKARKILCKTKNTILQVVLKRRCII